LRRAVLIGAVPQPVEVFCGVSRRVFPVVARDVIDPYLAAGDLPGKPAAVAGRDEDVSEPVAQQHRNLDLIEVEPPRPSKGERIVDPAANTTTRPLKPGLGRHLSYRGNHGR